MSNQHSPLKGWFTLFTLIRVNHPFKGESPLKKGENELLRSYSPFKRVNNIILKGWITLKKDELKKMVNGKRVNEGWFTIKKAKSHKGELFMLRINHSPFWSVINHLFPLCNLLLRDSTFFRVNHPSFILFLLPFFFSSHSWGWFAL